MLKLDRLLKPKTIAVFGGKEAQQVIRECDRIGFAGDIFPLHPTKNSILGRPCYRQLSELPSAPDASFIAVNRHLTLEIIAALAEQGAGGAVCYASGFSETGDVELQHQLIQAAADIPFIGPNCYGFINYLDGVLLWPDQHGGKRVERGVALLTQSGNMAINLTMQRRGLPVAYVVASGNQAQQGLAALLHAMLDDSRVTAIGIHLEGIDDVDLLQQAALRARAQGVPIVVLKAGKSKTGAELALSHTASLAGNDELVSAFFKRFGIARVNSLPVFLETLKLLHINGPLADNRIASMSCSGGEASLLADAAEGRSIEFPALNALQAEAVKATVNDLVTVSNPLDYHTFSWGDEAALYQTYAAMLRCGFAMTLLVLDLPRTDRCMDASWQLAIRALQQAVAETHARAGILATLPECLPEQDAEQLIAQGIVPFFGVDDAFCALEAAAAIAAAWQMPEPESIPLPVKAVNNPADSFFLDEWSAKQRLQDYGIIVPAGYKALFEQVTDVADVLGFPVVLKALGEHLIHKTEQGAVMLNLHDNVTLIQAARTIQHLSDEFLVETMVADAVAEVIIGVNVDPQFGLYLVLGSGGILVELLADSQVLLLPASRDEIYRALKALRVYKLLSGYRSQACGDIEALVDAVEAVVCFAGDHRDRLLELDINPLIVRSAGLGVTAVDALIRMRS